MTGGVVLVIGPTGRNFAAGMSGGIAYVLDEDGQFARKCNPSMVELLDISHDTPDGIGKELIEADPLQYDPERIRMMLEAHAEHTGSIRAREILDNWQDYRGKFVKVLPTDYKRAMLELQAEARGEAPAETDKPNLRVIG